MASFKIYYEQSVTDGGTTSIVTNYFSTGDNLFAENELNNPWNAKGCYGGAEAKNNSNIGGVSYVYWTGWKNDRGISDLRDYQVAYSTYSELQNLRFCLKYNSSSFQVAKQRFKWTGLRDETVNTINNTLGTSTSANIYDPYIRNTKNLNQKGTSNSPLNVAPLLNLKINDLIFVPTFIIREIEYYGYNSDINGYANSESQSLPTAVYNWFQVKPEDKTEQGEYYDEDLYTVGYKEITPVHEDGVRYRYCCGVRLVPYYGKSSKIYDVNNDNYIESINPDDGLQYGLRNIFGSIISQADEYPVIDNINNLNRPCLIVMSEIYDSVSDGIIYSTPAGLSFCNYSGAPIEANAYGIQSNTSLTTNYQLFSTYESWSTFFFTANDNYCCFYKDQNPTDAFPDSPVLAVSSTKLNINATDISSIDSTYPSGNIFYLENTPVAYTYRRGTRVSQMGNLSYFSIDELWHTIASLGCYVADDIIHARNAQVGKYIGENNHIYLGKMNSSRITDGTFLQGSDISDSVQSEIDDIIEGTPYVPVNPQSKNDGDDPDREDINPPNREGDNIPLHLNNRFGLFNGFLTMYNLTESELSNFGSALMGNPLNYRGNFEKDLSQELSGTYDVSSILNYIVSVKMYPFSVATLPNTTVLGDANVYMGTGEFGIPIGTQCRKLTSSISVLDAGQLDVRPLTPYKDFRDYYNTTIVCYMPYCGCVELNPMDIMNTVLHCYYLIDFLTGDCSAVLYSIGSNNINYPVAIANGNIGVDIPLSANNTGQLEAVKRMQNSAKAHTIVSYINAGIETAENLLSIGSFDPQDVSDVAGVVDVFSNAVTSFTNIWAENNANPYGANQSARSAVATPIMPMGSGATNFMLSNSVYLQIRRGTYSKPKNYARTMGYPTTFSDILHNVHGLTYCSGVEVNGINCTQEERALIKSALEGGTILP